MAKRTMRRDRIFSGDYSASMWDEINSARNISQVKSAMYLMGCRLQEFEAKMSEALEGGKTEEMRPCPLDEIVQCNMKGTCVGCDIMNEHLTYNKMGRPNG